MPRPILLVEDNPMDLDLTLRTFRSLGMEDSIEIARDGEEALEWMARWEDRDLAAAYSQGANSYLQKPLEYEVFLSITERIREYWGRLNLTPDGTVRP